MLCLENGTTVQRDDAALKLIPESTKSWHPVPHDTVLDLAEYHLQDRGIEFDTEILTRPDGDLAHAVMFAQFSIHSETLPADAVDGSLQHTLVLINSHNKTMALEGIAGFLL